jgi:thiol-disulfide isomerase/thioredoxin
MTVILLPLGYALYKSTVFKNEYIVADFEAKNTVLTRLPEVAFSTLDNVSFPIVSSPTRKLMIHFWATWCAPCEAEFPELVRLTESLKDADVDFLFVAVNDDLQKVKKILNRFRSFDNFTILLDNEGLHQKHFGSTRMPETFLFNSDGLVLKKFAGPQNWDLPIFRDILLKN